MRSALRPQGTRSAGATPGLGSIASAGSGDAPVRDSLVDLLGDTRAQVVDLLRASPATVAEVAARLGLSEAAVRRHLVALERDGFVTARTVRGTGRGRPSARHSLTERARRLYPDSSAAVANEVLDYLEDRHGRGALLEFLRWRQGRQEERYTAALDGVDDQRDRAERLAVLLRDDGFLADVASAPVGPADGSTVLELTQGHCAIADVAAAHPEICAWEAALFQRLLGGRLSRRQTIAAGDAACVCTITHPDRSSTTTTTDISTGAGHGHEA